MKNLTLSFLRVSIVVLMALAIGVENGKDFLVAGNSIESVDDGQYLPGNVGAGIAVGSKGANNRIFNNTAFENDTLDLVDYGTDNRWWNNEYDTANW